MFDYLIEKIQTSRFLGNPFWHLEIDDFFSDEHFTAIVNAPEIRLDLAVNDRNLISMLRQLTYRQIEFPGTATSIADYLAWRENPHRRHTNVDTCEGFGLTFRLGRAMPGGIVELLNVFFTSERFLECLMDKFGQSGADVRPDIGLQKYLSGYEISPHPDVRAKALTYMINVNPDDSSERQDYHTHYMRFKPERAYVEAYWRGNPQDDRCWVPWSWCETVKRQTRNNSIVIFAPTDNTLHAVKANYDHLPAQRTQFYGNLWYRRIDKTGKPVWHDFEIKPSRERRPRTTMIQELVERLPMKEQLRRVKQKVLGR
jgi:hypothetical protein